MTTVQQVLSALAEVRDPELDEPLTELGFVAAVRVLRSRVQVRLRLPTYFCAPNFAWLMVDGARSAIRSLDGVEEVDVELEGHFAADELNRATSLEGAFPGQVGGTLTELRDLFARKAFVTRQARLCDALLGVGRTAEDVAALRLCDLESGPELARCVSLRAELGIDASAAAPAFVAPDGRPLDAAGLKRWLRMARLVRVSLEGNAGICRALLKTRYKVSDPEEAAA